MFVFDPAMPAMGGGRILNRRRQRKGPIAGMARSYTGEKRACFTLTFMAVATPEDEKSASIVGAGFKPALRREIGSIRHGTALGGFETRYKTVLRPYVCDVFHANNHDAR